VKVFTKRYSLGEFSQQYYADYPQVRVKEIRTERGIGYEVQQHIAGVIRHYRTIFSIWGTQITVKEKGAYQRARVLALAYEAYVDKDCVAIILPVTKDIK
jgi:hypothetical protein